MRYSSGGSWRRRGGESATNEQRGEVRWDAHEGGREAELRLRMSEEGGASSCSAHRMGRSGCDCCSTEWFECE